MFNFVAGEEEGHFKGIVGKFFGVGPSNEKLFDPWCGKGGFFSEDAGINGDDAPTQRDKAPAGDDFFGDAANMGLGVFVLGWKEEETNAEIAISVELVTEFFNFAAK
jgi:hypothetical protein